MHKINILIGANPQDWFGSVPKFEVYTELSVEEVKEAYRFGSKIVGLDIVAIAAARPDKCYLTVEEYNILSKNFDMFALDTVDQDVDGNTIYTLSTGFYFAIWLVIANKGTDTAINPSIVWKEEEINLGGSGFVN